LQMDGPPAEVTRAYQQFVVHGAPVDDPTAQATFQPDIVQLTEDDQVVRSLAAEHRHVYLGKGWYDLEAYSGDIFRWAQPEAEFVMTRAVPGRDRLVLDIEPGPSAGPPPVPVRVIDAQGDPVLD